MKSFTKDGSPRETGSKGKALWVMEAINGKTSPKVTILKNKQTQKTPAILEYS